MNYHGYMLDDAHILMVMETTRRHGGVTMVHAENGHCVHWLSDRLERAEPPHLSRFSGASQ
jgi:dihydropyrimidinase